MISCRVMLLRRRRRLLIDCAQGERKSAFLRLCRCLALLLLLLILHLLLQCVVRHSPKGVVLATGTDSPTHGPFYPLPAAVVLVDECHRLEHSEIVKRVQLQANPYQSTSTISITNQRSIDRLFKLINYSTFAARELLLKKLPLFP